MENEAGVRKNPRGALALIPYSNVSEGMMDLGMRSISYINDKYIHTAHLDAVLVHMFHVLLLANPTLTRFALSVLLSQVTTILTAPFLRSAPACPAFMYTYDLFPTTHDMPCFLCHASSNTGTGPLRSEADRLP